MFPTDFVKHRSIGKSHHTKAGDNIRNNTQVNQKHHGFAGNLGKDFGIAGTGIGTNAFQTCRISAGTVGIATDADIFVRIILTAFFLLYTGYLIFFRYLLFSLLIQFVLHLFYGFLCRFLCLTSCQSSCLFITQAIFLLGLFRTGLTLLRSGYHRLALLKFLGQLVQLLFGLVRQLVLFLLHLLSSFPLFLCCLFLSLCLFILILFIVIQSIKTIFNLTYGFFIFILRYLPTSQHCIIHTLKSRTQVIGIVYHCFHSFRRI